MKNEILNVIEKLNEREIIVIDRIKNAKPDMVDFEWKALIKVRKYRVELQEELNNL